MPSSLDARRAFNILAAYILLQLGIALVVVILALLSLDLGISRNQLAVKLQVVALVPAALAGTTVGAVAIFRMTRRTLPGSIASGALNAIGWFWGSKRALIASGAIGATISAFVLFVLIPHVPPTSGHSSNALTQVASTPGLRRLGWVVFALVLAPPAEEFLFRGVLLEGFRRSWGPITASLLVTGLFIALHLPQTHYWPAIAGISLLAAGTLCVRWVTGALGPALVLHIAYNLVLVLAVYSRAA